MDRLSRTSAVRRRDDSTMVAHTLLEADLAVAPFAKNRQRFMIFVADDFLCWLNHV